MASPARATSFPGIADSIKRAVKSLFEDHSQIQSHFGGPQTRTTIVGATGCYRSIRKNGAPLPVWFRSLACGNTIRELLPPIVSTFTRSEPRGSERLSAPEHHRYVRVLDWTVAYESAKTASGEAGDRL